MSIAVETSRRAGNGTSRLPGMTKAEALEIASKLRSPASWEYLPVADMKVDPRAQRTIRIAWVKRHVPVFDPGQLGAVCISRRPDGSLWIMDGQHRVELVRMVGWADQLIYSEVFAGLTLKEEAALFLARNDKLSPRTFDKFIVGLTAQEDVPQAINRIVLAAGLIIAEGRQEGAVAAVSALRRIYTGAGAASEKEGGLALQRTLRAITDAWGRESANFSGEVIEGLGLFFLRYGTQVEHKALVEVLARIAGGAAKLATLAKPMRDSYLGTLSQAIGGVIVQRYNRRRRSGKLDGWWS